MVHVTGAGNSTNHKYALTYPQPTNMSSWILSQPSATVNYSDLAVQQALLQALAQQQGDSTDMPNITDMGSWASDAYDYLSGGVDDGVKSLQDWWELNTTPVGSGSALSESSLNTSANLISSGNPLYSSFGGGPGALATGSAGGDAASLAAAESAVGANSTTASLAGAGSMFTGAGIGGAVGPLVANAVYGDKESNYSGASLVGGVGGGAAAGAIGGSMFGPVGTILGGLLGGITGSMGLGGAAGGWGPGITKPKVGTNINANFLSGWTDPYGKYYDTEGMSEEEKSKLYGQDLRTIMSNNLWGDSGSYGLEKDWLEGYRYNSNYLGTTAKVEQNKILNDIAFMEDQGMAKKLYDALSKKTINFSTTMDVTNQTHAQSRAARDSLRNSIQATYDAAKKEVGYEG